jgi:DNA-binding NtrC family response regulator
MTEVLVVEDDPALRELLVRTLGEAGYAVEAAAALSSSRKVLARRSFDVALLDVHLGDGSGLDLIEPLKETAGAAQFVVMSALADPKTIALAIKKGAFEFVEKPLDPPRLLAVLERAAEKARLLRENASLRELASGATPFVPLERLGRAMQEVASKIERAAPLDVPILIQGESGTGKELVARTIHAASPRARAIWLPVNCGAFKPELIDSELFGHEKGAFTGAADRRLGLVEVARGGTLLLDEVAELPQDAQASLLRFIEQGEYRRVGGTEILSSSVRILAATNRDLEQAVKAGRFREDLYFRLAVVSIKVPPLRERREDIPVVVEHFLKLRGFARPFSKEVMAALEARAWPGNLRELRNAVDRLIVAGGPGKTSPKDLDDGPGPIAQARDMTLAEVEREHIARVFAQNKGNRTLTAKVLDINPRTLYRKIREYGLEG